MSLSWGQRSGEPTHLFSGEKPHDDVREVCCDSGRLAYLYRA